MRNSTLLKTALKKGLTAANIDLETSPYLSWHYPMWDVNIGYDCIEVPMQVTSIGWLDLNTRELVVEGWEYPKDKLGILKKDKDRKLLTEAVEKLNKYDLLIGQNLDSYDIKVLNWRLNELDLPALKNIVTIDTLKMSKKVFRPPSHKLDYKSLTYGKGGKIPQTMQDCIAVAKGDSKKQALRMKYNGKDCLDADSMMWKEIDYWQLPKSMIKMLKEYVKEDKPFCVKCAARRQKRFEVNRVKIKHEFKYQCQNCDSIWKIKRA